MNEPGALLATLGSMLELNGLSAADLAAFMETGELHTGKPLLRDYIATVAASLTENTGRTWATHLNRLVDGTAMHCDCLCERCLDLPGSKFCDCLRRAVDSHGR